MSGTELSEQEMADAVCDILADRLRLHVVIPGSGLEWEETIAFQETRDGLTLKTGTLIQRAMLAPHHCDKAYIEIVGGPPKWVGVRLSMSLDMHGYGGYRMNAGDSLELRVNLTL